MVGNFRFQSTALAAVRNQSLLQSKELVMMKRSDARLNKTASDGNICIQVIHLNYVVLNVASILQYYVCVVISSFCVASRCISVAL